MKRKASSNVMKLFQIGSKNASLVVAALLILAFVARPALLWARTEAIPQENEVVASASAAGGDVNVKRSLTPVPNEFQSLELVLTYESPQGLRLNENELDGLYGDFLCEYVGEKSRALDADRQATARKWKLYPQKTGDLELPPIPATLSYPDASKSPVVVVVPPQTITIPAVDANVASDEGFAYILDPLAVVSPAKIALLVVAALLIALVAAAPRLRKKLGATRQLDAESPYDLAIRRLNELKGSRIYAENSSEFYLVVDDVLRRYLSDEFHIAAHEKTSSEILKSINDSRPDSTEETPSAPPSGEIQLSRAERMEIARRVLKDPEIQKTLRAALDALDRAKFAKRQTSFADASALYQAIRQTVENSRAAFQTETNRALDEKRKLAERDAETQKPS